MPATLYRLLWGPTPDLGLDRWTARPWEVPPLGLPTRVVTFLYSAARQSESPRNWWPEQGPLTWQFKGTVDVLSGGRLAQFDMDEQAASAPKRYSIEDVAVNRSTDWELPPHEAYFLPIVGSDSPDEIDPESYAHYCDVLLILTALDGGESILSSVARRGFGSVPFKDRWDWRSRIHLPETAWEKIEASLRWSEAPEYRLAKVSTELDAALASHTPSKITVEDFLQERVDLSLSSSASDETARTVRPPYSTDDSLPPELCLATDDLEDELLLRMGQTRSRLDRDAVVEAFPAATSELTSQLLEQTANAFHAPIHVGTDKSRTRPDLVIFPEVSVPQTEARTVRELVARTGIASLAGLYWRQLRPSYAAQGSTSAARRWFVNEAELAIPIGYDDRGPTSVRWYRARKPLPNHVETGLADALTQHQSSGDQRADGGPRWAVLNGRRWYRFLHPQWGDFTVAICSDLLDAAPWRSMQGELLHLFMVAFNQDVDLFDSLTWVRAYENYVNVVTVNDGGFGGSVLWTPRRRSHRRELAHLYGGNLSVVADVAVPVRGLIDAQCRGVEKAVEEHSADWLPIKTGDEDPCKRAPKRGEFKSPPPGYKRRSLRV